MEMATSILAQQKAAADELEATISILLQRSNWCCFARINKAAIIHAAGFVRRCVALKMATSISGIAKKLFLMGSKR
jgi:hypothetical protein